MVNEIDVKELVDIGRRTTLLLGEITGRLLVLEKVSFDDADAVQDEIKNLLSFINGRIGSIYYGEK